MEISWKNKKFKKVQKDYKRGEYNNPYFGNQKKNRSFNTGFYLKILAGVFLAYLLIYSPLFKIGQVEIEGQDMIDKQELLNLIYQNLNGHRFFIFPHNHMLFFSENKLKKELSKYYKFEEIDIDRKWQALDIKIQEKASHLIVYNLHNQQFYFADLNGILIKEISKDIVEEYWQRFAILNINQADITMGQEVCLAKTINFILRLDEKLKNTTIDVQGYEQGGVGEVNMVSRQGWRAFFNTMADLDISLENLTLVLNEKITDRDKLEYIDLRFGEKVFYK